VVIAHFPRRVRIHLPTLYLPDRRRRTCPGVTIVARDRTTVLVVHLGILDAGADKAWLTG